MFKLLKASLTALILAVVISAFGAGDEQTINTIPSPGTDFTSDLQTFLNQEDADRFDLIHDDFVASGGVISTGAGLTKAPTSLVAFIKGFYTTESGSITFNDDDTCWVIADKDQTGDQGTFTRVSGTHYLLDCTSTSEPTLPTDTIWIAKVVTASGSVSAVTDMRTTDVFGSSARVNFLASGENCDDDITSPSSGDLCVLPDSGIFVSYNGSAWVSSSGAVIPQAYGAVGDLEEYTDGVVDGTTNFTSSSRSCATADVGKQIEIVDAATGPVTHTTTVASCSGNDFTLTDAADLTDSGLLWKLYTDDRTALLAAANAVEIAGGTIFAPPGKYGYTDEWGADTSDGGSGTGTGYALGLVCADGAEFHRGSDCDAGTCSYRGSQMEIYLFSKTRVRIHNCKFDGGSDYEDSSSTYRGKVVATAPNVYVTGNTWENVSSALNTGGVSADGTTLQYALYRDNKVDNCWEGGLLLRARQVGTAADPATIIYANNDIECEVVHPNEASLGLQGTNPLNIELDPDASTLFYIDLLLIVYNELVCGGNQSSDPTCLTFLSSGTGSYLLKNTIIDGNVIRCAASGSHDTPECVSRMIDGVVTDRDTAGDEIARLQITNNLIQIEDAHQASTGLINAKSTESGNLPTNLKLALIVGGNTISIATGNQATVSCIRALGDWNVVDIRRGYCTRSAQGAGSTNFTGAVELVNSVEHLSVEPPLGGWSANNLAEAPIIFTNGETYGVQPGQWIYFARADLDDGDRQRLFSFASPVCLDVTLAYQAMLKDYGTLCTSNSGSTSYATAMPRQEVTDSSHDVVLQVLENDGSNNTIFSVLQRDGAGATDDILIGFQVRAIRELGTESLQMTFDTTDDGSQMMASTPLPHNREIISWRYELLATDFTAAATSEDITVLTVPSGWAVRDVYINHVLNFAGNEATCTVTDLTATLGDTDDPDGYLVSFQPDVSAARVLGDQISEAGVYNPDKAAVASSEARIVWGAYNPDQSAVFVRLDCGAGNLGDGGTSDLTAGQLDIHAKLSPLN